MIEEKIEIVDENNNVIGVEDRSLVLQKGLLHRASHIFVLNSQKEIFLQKRSSTKASWPSKWDISVGETLKPKESFEEGAIRGMSEELGIRQTTVIKIGDTFYSSYTDALHHIEAKGFFQLFVVYYDGEITLSTVEIEEGDFYSLADIESMMKNPAQFTPWFLYDWEFFIKWYKNQNA